MARAVFLDRDGVINEDSSAFIRSVHEWKPIPGSLEAIARLSGVGFTVVVVTNQSGVARGLLDMKQLSRIHAELIHSVEAAGGSIAGIFFCPHAPEDGCDCRKPESGLIRRACLSLGLDAKGAPMVGDRLSDVEAARRAGCRPFLVQTGLLDASKSAAAELGDVTVCRDLAAAAETILRDQAGATRPVAMLSKARLQTTARK